MSFFRLIALALLVWILWFLWRNYRVQASRQREQRKQARLGERVVKCSNCDLHLPEASALRDGDHWFCSNAHRQAWLQRQPD